METDIDRSNTCSDKEMCIVEDTDIVPVDEGESNYTPIVMKDMNNSVHDEIELLNKDCEVINIENEDESVNDGNNPLIEEDLNMIRAADKGFDLSGCLVGTKRNTLDEVYELYRLHASMIGFSIRKNTSRSRKVDGEYKQCEKYYVCSYEGFEKKKQKNPILPSSNIEEDDSTQAKKRRAKFTRTGCGAFLRVKMNKEGVFEVVTHVVAHNHELTKTKWRHYHRSERDITEEKAEAIAVMTKAAMKTSVQYNYMVEEYGGEELLGHTKKDHYNFVHSLKVKQIEGGDAQSLVDLLHQSAYEDSGFFFRVKLDADGRLCNVFWRDSMMKEDFLIYGDVVVFDTTYRTNKYELICGAFVGINNHWKNVMFGCAFLADERAESFEWLFEVFKKSMEGLEPISIFTDQDQAMTNALEKVFPSARHRLCQWHIYQNAVKHYGKLKHDKSFNEAFTKCMKGCCTVAEFEISWADMIKNYGLEDNAWFQRLYALKDKWCTALSKDFFSAGILSSQRSESTNSAIGFRATKTTNLTEFYGIISSTVKNWRSVEQKDEYDCSCKVPSTNLPMFGLLKHAAQIYTIALFRVFERECMVAFSTSVAALPSPEHGLFIYHVYPEDKPELLHQVNFISATVEVTCTCKRFEETGMLCSHVIRVLFTHSVNHIPERYIRRRWTKFAKSEVWSKEDASDAFGTSLKKDSIPWRHIMTRRYYNLVIKSHGNEQARQILESSYSRDSAQIEELLSNLRVSDSTIVDQQSKSGGEPSTIVLDPVRSQTKGRVSRKKGALERRKKKRQQQSVHPGAEFGTKTPNPRLF